MIAARVLLSLRKTGSRMSLDNCPKARCLSPRKCSYTLDDGRRDIEAITDFSTSSGDRRVRSAGGLSDNHGVKEKSPLARMA